MNIIHTQTCVLCTKHSPTTVYKESWTKRRAILFTIIVANYFACYILEPIKNAHVYYEIMHIVTMTVLKFTLLLYFTFFSAQPLI